jgi:endo-1,4-beta-xylanase
MKRIPSPCLRARGLLAACFGLFLAHAAPAAELPPLKDLFRDHFPVGTAVNRGHVTGTASFRRSTELIERDVALVKAQFNQITAENDMKWQLIHPREGAEGYDFGPTDAFVEFGAKHGMQVVGHTLVWHSQTPNWVFAGTNPPPPSVTNAANATAPAAPAPPATTAAVAAASSSSSSPASTNAASTNRFGGRGRGGPGFGPGPGFGRYDGPRASREQLLERMRDHIRTVVGRYKGRVKVWDVVNEALADGNGTNVYRNSLWFEIIGPDFIAKAFQYAHEADPQAILRYNDYGLENPAKRKRLAALIKDLQRQGIPVHAIGTQAHVNVGMTFETMDQSLTEIAALGLPIHVTELDVNGAQGGQRGTGADVGANAATTQGGLVEDADRRLADAYAGIFKAFVKHRDSVKMVTFWGANDGVSWRAQGKPLLFDGENRPKPAFDAVIAVGRNAVVK